MDEFLNLIRSAIKDIEAPESYVIAKNLVRMERKP